MLSVDLCMGSDLFVSVDLFVCRFCLDISRLFVGKYMFGGILMRLFGMRLCEGIFIYRLLCSVVVVFVSWLVRFVVDVSVW